MLALRPLGKVGREMRVAEASAVVPLSPEETWDVLIGDQMQRLVEMPDISVVAVEDYEVRPDGTARYVVANKAGPSTIWHTADFTVYERPHRSVNRVLDSPFGGMFYGTYEPTAAGGTRVSWHWEVESQNPLAAVLVPMMRPLFARSMQQDLDALAKEGGTVPQENLQRRSVAPKASLLGGVALVVILVLYLLRRRSSARQRRK
jgi:Polyketide cyclase / dehydrase and lipid transport